MIVITLTDCPPALRGDLTKWLQEINTGVYVGRVSARVRDILWERVKKYSKSGRATMVYSTNNEQHMDFRVHNTIWEPIDFDGLKLILRPSPSRIKKLAELRMAYSKAAKMRKARQMSRRKQKSKSLPDTYAIIDLVTSGPSLSEEELLQICALKVHKGKVQESFNRFVKYKPVIPSPLGLETNTSGEKSCKEIAQVLPEFISFIGDAPIVTHDTEAIYGFLRSACEGLCIPLFSNQSIDILALSRRYLEDVKNYKFETLLEYFKIDFGDQPDCCLATKSLYDKLIEIQQDQSKNPLV